MALSFDFSGEGEQKAPANYGPVPSGSVVYVKMELIPNRYPDPQDPLVSLTRTGLRQIFIKCEVTEGTYTGVFWHQNITLPAGMQPNETLLSQGQRKACQIGGAQIKAILAANGRPFKIASMASLSGLIFPCRVKLQNEPYNKDGKEYWRNEISVILTPEHKDWQAVKAKRELINQSGDVVGISQQKQGYEYDRRMDYGGYKHADPLPSEGYDDYPLPSVGAGKEVDEIPF